MPTYGYKCIQCQHEFQTFQTMKEPPLESCPECGGSVKRLLYPVGIIFKGSGWYITDSRKQENSSPSPESSSEKSSDSAEKAAASKTEPTA